MKIVSSVIGGGDRDFDKLDYVVIALSPEACADLLKKRDAIIVVKKRYPSFHRAEFFDYRLTAFGHCAWLDEPAKDCAAHGYEGNETLGEFLECVAGSDGWIEVNDKFAVPENAQGRLSCPCVAIGADDVMWTFSPKHVDGVQLESQTIPWEAIQAIADTAA